MTTITGSAAPETGALLKEYQEDGYIVVRNLLTPEHIEKLKARARQFALGDIPPGSEKMVVHDVRVAKGLYKPDDPEMGLWKFRHPDHYDSLFYEYPATPKILDVVEGLVGPDIKTILTMYIYKPPMLESVHDYHQDGYYFHFGPHDLVLGTWVALDRTTADNGTLCVIPGSHKRGILKHETPEGEHVNAGIYGVRGAEEDPNTVTLELEPGDGVFFHCRLLHSTGPNKTMGHRRVLTVHYVSALCKMEENQKYNYDFRLVRGKSHEGCV